MKVKFSFHFQVALFLLYLTSFALVYQLYMTLPPVFQDNELPDSDLPIENEKEPWKNFRLPNNIQPRNYDIILRPDVVNDISYGEEIVTVEVLEPTTFVIIHAIEGGFTDIDEFVVRQDGSVLGKVREL